MNVQSYDVCIVGLGPAGLGAALRFARSGFAGSVICLEGGVSAAEKGCSILEGNKCRYEHPCQMISGVGGSSLLSSGKVSLYPAGRSLSPILGGELRTEEGLGQALNIFRQYVPLIDPKVDADMRKAAAEQYSTLGFEYRYYDAFLFEQSALVQGYSAMHRDICEAGISVKLCAQVLSVRRGEEGHTVVAKHLGKPLEIRARKVILAVGRLGVSLLSDLDSTLGLGRSPNRVEVGVRLEFPTASWPDIDRHHNDLKLHFGDARTFCVSKDGYLAPYRIRDFFLVEGHSDPSGGTGFTNLAIALRRPLPSGSSEASLLQHVRMKVREQSDGRPVRTMLTDYLQGTGTHPLATHVPSSIGFWTWGDAFRCLPEPLSVDVRDAVRFFISQLMPPTLWSSVSVFAPEIDYYWGRYPISHGFLSQVRDLYLIGDCTGLFRGILQAFCTGLECAQHILDEPLA